MCAMVNEALLQDFVADSREHLSSIEPDLLAMESQGAQVDPEVVNRVFRAVHSIKGFSSFLGFKNLSDLSHAMESLLSCFRDGRLATDPERIDALLAGVDKLRVMVDDIHNCAAVACDEEMAALGRALATAASAPAASASPPPAGNAKPQAAPATPAAPPATVVGHGQTRLSAGAGLGPETVVFAVEPAALAEARQAGLSLLALWLSPAEDLEGKGRDAGGFLKTLESCGTCLASDLQDEPSAAPWRHCLLATFIDDPEIAAATLDLAEDRVRLLPAEAAAPSALEAEAVSAPAPIPAAAVEAPAGLAEVRAAWPGRAEPVVMAVEGAALAQALGNGLFFWAGLVEPGEDLAEGQAGPASSLASFLANLDSCGKRLFCDVEQAVAQGRAGSFLLASVIEEAEMAQAALELPAERLTRLTREEVEANLSALVAAPPPQAFPSVTAATAAAPAPTAALAVHAAEAVRENVCPAPAPASAPAPAPGESRPAQPAETIRVGVNLIDQLINLAGELVLGRNQLVRMLQDAARRDPVLGPVMQKMDQVTSELQENMMQLRMQPLGYVLGKFPRVVREISRQLGKQAELTILGAEVELDKSILEQLSDPLTHLVRNSLDHGLESPEEREGLGKPRAGQIIMRAFHEEGMVNLAIQDDGRGIDAEKVAAKAVALGLISADEVRRLSQAEKLALITMPGLSTAQQVSDLSGRGVGMDVVATNIQKIGGHLQIESEPGVGTTIRLRLPLTMAIIPSLVVGAGELVFAIAQTDVQELVSIQSRQAAERIEMVGEAPVIRLRDRLLPLVRLSDVLGIKRSFRHPRTGQLAEDRRLRIADRRRRHDAQLLDPEQAADQAAGQAASPERDSRARAERRGRRADDTNVVVLRVGSNRYGLIVDRLFDTEEIVVKPLPRHIKDCRCFSGATIMGDGRVAMILDAGGIAERARLRFGEIRAVEDLHRAERARQEAAEAAGPARNLLLLGNVAEELLAVPLEEVARLEVINPAAIQRVAGRECVEYGGGGLSLLRLERYLPVAPCPPQASPLFAIIPKAGGHRIGLVCAAIEDVAFTRAAVQALPGPMPCAQGLVDLKGRLALLLDMAGLLAAFERDQPPTPAGQAGLAAAAEPGQEGGEVRP
jgi:two-component system chemotaxis sensor kinase CheA